MAELTVDLTYGSALFAAAKDLQKVELFSEESAALLAVLEREPDLQAFLDTPAVSAREKKAVVETIFKGRLCDELLNFLRILIDKGRTRRLAQIVRVFEGLIHKEEGVAYGEIFSVKPLAEARLRKLEAEVSKLLQLKVQLENKLDAGLVGGVKVYVEGKIIDASIKGRLHELRDSIGQSY